MIDRWIAEATECDFKVALDVSKILCKLHIGWRTEQN